jgi:O-antigen ligase
MTEHPLRAAAETRRGIGMWMLAAGLSVMLLLATLGEGGGSVNGLLAWHTVFVTLLLAVLVLPVVTRRLTHNLSGGILAGLTVIMGLSVFSAVQGSNVFSAALTLAEMGICFVVMALAGRCGPGLLHLAYWPLLVGGALQAVVVLGQRILGGLPRPAGTFLNVNHMSCWLVAILLFGLGGAARLESRRSRWLAGVLGSMIGLGIMLGSSRGAFLGALAGGLWLAWRFWRKASVKQRSVVALLGVLVALLVGLRMLDRDLTSNAFRYHRVKIWQASLSILNENPWWGCGPGQFKWAAKRVQFEDGDGPLNYDTIFRIPHSDVVRLPVEFGGFTALAGLAVLMLGITTLRRTSKRLGRSPPEWGATAALVAIAVQAIVDDPSTWPAVYLLASVFLGALLAVPERPATRVLTPSRFVAATLLLLVFFVGDVGTWQAHRLVSALPDGWLSRNQLSQLKRAQRLNPVQPSYHMRLAEAAMANRTSWTLDDYSRARIDAETAIRLHPAESKYHWTLARVEGRGCRELFRDLKSRDRAYSEFRAAQQLAPHDVRISLQAGAFALSVGDPLTARERADYALGLEPNAVPGHLLLAEIELNSLANDLDRIDDHLNTAMTIAAENPPNRLSTSYERQLLDIDNNRLAAITRRLTERRGMATQ